MAVGQRQLAAFAETHLTNVPFDVSPRYLAGPGDARHVTHALAAVGRSCSSDPLSPQVVLTSPERDARLSLNPLSASLPCWRVEGHPVDGPYWWAAFDELVPAEIIAGLTDALIPGRSAGQPDVRDVLAAADWTVTGRNGQVSSAHSPDDMVSVEFHDDSTETFSWRIEARARPGEGPALWAIRLQGQTPAPMVSGLFTALASSEPVQRAMSDRTAHYSAPKEPSPLQPQQVVAAHTNRLARLRSQARAQRRRQHAAPDRPAAGLPTPGRQAPRPYQVTRPKDPS
ncbi:DUF317 domain-containing protein [Streptomyces albus]|uniref:DUF317 domain-containing protein n=1 Tax=Streptomyces albus TaxID=1888 RepID=UPI0034044C87